MRALKTRSSLASYRSWQRPTERVIKADPLTTAWEIIQDLNVDHPMAIWHLKWIGKVKKLNKWVPHVLTTSQKTKKIILKCLLLFCAGTMKHYSIGLWDATKIGFYITISDGKLSFQTYKKLQSTSQSQASTIKMVMVPVWWSAVGLIHYSFLNLGKTITSEKYAQQINEMYWKLQGCTKCWSTERAQFFSGTTPDYMSHNQPFRRQRSLASFVKFTWPVLKWLPLFQASC